MRIPSSSTISILVLRLSLLSKIAFRIRVYSVLVTLGSSANRQKHIRLGLACLETYFFLFLQYIRAICLVWRWRRRSRLILAGVAFLPMACFG